MSIAPEAPCHSDLLPVTVILFQAPDPHCGQVTGAIDAALAGAGTAADYTLGSRRLPQLVTILGADVEFRVFIGHDFWHRFLSGLYADYFHLVTQVLVNVPVPTSEERRV